MLAKPGDMVQSATMQHGILSAASSSSMNYRNILYISYFSSTKRKINKNSANYSKSNAECSDIKVCQCCKICVGKVPHTPTRFSSPSSGDYVHFDQKHKTLQIHNLCLVACLAAVHTPVFTESWHADSLRSGPILSYAGMRHSLPGVPAYLDELGTHAFFEVLQTFRHPSLSSAGTAEQIR